MSTDFIRPTIVIACTMLMLYTNLLGSGGPDLAEESSSPGIYYAYPTPISPAPFTFAIWIPIFLGTCGIAIYQALPSQIRNRSLDIFAVPYSIALVANAATPFLRIGWSNLVVVSLFGSLCVAYAFLSSNPNPPQSENLCLRMPLLAFATWCGVASVINLCQWMVSVHITVSASLAAAFACITMASGVFAILATKQPIIAFVMLWSGLGIAYAQPSYNEISHAILLASIPTMVVAYLVSR